MDGGLPFISELVLSTNTFLTSTLSPMSRAEGVTRLSNLVLFFSATLAALLVAILYFALLKVGFEMLYILGV